MGYSLNPPKRQNCHYDESHPQRESPYLKRFDPSKFQKQVQKFRYDGRNILASGTANNPYGSGQWIGVMRDKWGKRNTNRFLNLFLNEFSGRLEAHEKALPQLTEDSTIEEMRELVNEYKLGLYPPGRPPSGNRVDANTGEMTIRPYVSSDNMNADMNSYLNHHMAAVHEPIHSRDIANAREQGIDHRNGKFGAQTEINAYSRNVEVLQNAIDSLK